jgi:hypothetical protein
MTVLVAQHFEGIARDMATVFHPVKESVDEFSVAYYRLQGAVSEALVQPGLYRLFS